MEDMDEMTVRQLTRMMLDDDHPEAFEVCDYTGNYAGDRIRFPGVGVTEGGDLKAAKVRGDCSTEAWFADKDCKWLVFRDTDGDAAIIHIHALIDKAKKLRKEFDEAKVNAEAEAGSPG